MKEVKIPSAVPVYGAAVTVLLYCLVGKMYRLSDLLICAGLALLTYAVLNKLFPGTVKTVIEPEKPTGNEPLDEAIRQGREAAAELRRLNDAIPDEALSADLDEIAELTERIFGQVQKEPDKLPQIRQMMTYYLPTVIRLLGKYAELQKQADVPNVRKSLDEISSAVRTIRQAFRRQLDSLYEHDVIDITADVRVMEQMLRTSGLTDEHEFETEKEKS